MAGPEHGLLATDEDLQAFLARMVMPPEPINAGYTHSFSPAIQARINAEVQRAGGGMPQTVTPTAGLTMGPLSLDGGLQLQQAINPETGSPYTQVKPTMGAGLKVPLPGDATAEAKFNYTPEYLKAVEMAYRRKFLGGDLDLTLRHSQPYQGTPDTTFGARWSRRF